MATVSKSGAGEGVNKNSSGTCEDVSTLCKAQRSKEVLHILDHRDILADSSTYISLLRQCIKSKDLEIGKQVHAHIIQTGFNPNFLVLNTLVNMYAKCGSVVDARQVFDNMPKRDVFTCTIMMSGYTKHGRGREAFEIYQQMRQEGVTPNNVTFICLLKACASLGTLQKGKEVHADILKAGIATDMILETALADMYAKCGSVKDARRVFDNMAQRDIVSWNAMITGYVQQGCCREAVEIYGQMLREQVMPNKVTFICVLNACASLGALEKGKEVHADIIKSGIVPDIMLENTLIDMYAKCGSMPDARHVFDNMAKQNVVSWNAIMAGCGREAFEMYEQMIREEVTPNSVTYTCLLHVCASLGFLEKGKQAHADIRKFGIAPDINLENTLVHMYAKCGSIKDACEVFNDMAERNVVSWSTMIAGYSQHGCAMQAFKLYEQMICEGVMPNKITFIYVLNACASLGALKLGEDVHSHIVAAGIEPDIRLGNTLVDMYAKCGSIEDARQVFDSMTEQDVVSWNAMITGYAQHSCYRLAFELYELMMSERVTPDKITFLCVLNACASLGALGKGNQVHADIVQAEIMPDIILQTTLVDMYVKCGSLKDACQVFDSMAQRDLVSWNVMIGGYAQHACVLEAFETFEQMMQAGVMPNRVTFMCVLNVCARLGALEKGKKVHADIMKAGIEPDVSMENTLVDMYAKCGSLEDARQVFDNMAEQDVVSWNIMIAGYAQHGCGREAFEMYEQMRKEGLIPDKVTFMCVLNMCAHLGALEKGKEVHADVMKAGIASYIDLETTLVHMYAKCGSTKDARQVFDSMTRRNVFTWSTMIAGYAQHGCSREAFVIYEQMIQEGLTPDKVTFIGVLNACSSLAILEKGREVHADIIKAGIAPHANLENALVNMYVKCGSMKDAGQVFDNMVKRDVVSWSAMIAGYGQHGCGREVLQLFEQLQHEGLKPDSITFINILSACSHLGLVDEGYHYFDSMSRDHGLTPTVEHFGCMVDLLGRAGRLCEAENFINKMPIDPGVGVWGALLGACRKHGNVGVAERVAKCLLRWDPQDASIHAKLRLDG